MRKPRFIPLVRHVIEEAIRIGIREGTMLAPSFHVVTALDKVQAALITPIRARVKPAFAIELDAERVAASFRKQLKLARHGVVSPDGLTQKMNAAHRRRARASL